MKEINTVHRSFGIISLILCCALLISSCSKDVLSSDMASESVEAQDSSTSGVEYDIGHFEPISTTVLNESQNYYDQRTDDPPKSLDEDVDNLLVQLREGDPEGFCAALNRTDEVRHKKSDCTECQENIYGFLKDVKIDNATVIKKVPWMADPGDGEAEQYYDYHIELNASKTDGKVIPYGKSEWVFCYVSSYDRYGYFCPVDKVEENRPQFDYTIPDVIDFCSDFDLEFAQLRNKSFTDINKVLVSLKHDIEPPTYIERPLIRFTIGQGNKKDEYSCYGVPVKHIKPLAMSLLGLSESYFDGISDEYILSTDFAGGYMCFYTVSEQRYNILTKVHTVTITYYADTFCFVPALTVTQRVRENKDGSFCLLSHKCVYDSGYKIATVWD